MGAPTRWETDTDDNHSDWYIERFRTMAAEGVDLEGEARLINAMVAPGSRLLDAGCGPGRTSGALHRWGHTVVGVDADPKLIEAAQATIVAGCSTTAFHVRLHRARRRLAGLVDEDEGPPTPSVPEPSPEPTADPITTPRLSWRNQ